MENIEYTPEQKAEIRKRELAILKAENQMLEEAKNNVTNTDKLDEIAKIKTLNDLNTAINDNKKVITLSLTWKPTESPAGVKKGNEPLC